MKAFPQPKSAGFTLIEMMIAVAILGTIVAMGMPSFRQMLRSAEIRSAAESISNGMQRARAEAVSRNAKVKFVLASATSSSWTVSDSAGTTLDSRDSSEGSTNATVAALASDLATAATTITYNQLGQVVTNADASQTLSRINVSATGSTRNLRVAIGAGGSARVCDPNMATGSNPRAC